MTVLTHTHMPLSARRTLVFLAAFVPSFAALAPMSAQAAPRYDVVITGGHVVDGTGAPWYAADVAVSNGRIAAIGHIPASLGKRAIDAKGLIVAPGFIDMMGQTATPFLENPNSAFNLLSQGITTINAGEGGSSAPLDGEEAKKAGWSTMRQLFAKLDSAGMPMNMVQTVGHTQLRQIVIGDKDRPATPEELERMRNYMREGMDAGAIGLSTSLIYPPAIYGSESEIAELAKVAGAAGGAYFTHMRNEGDRLLEAIDEALRIGQAAGTPVHIFHLKTAGQANWGKMDLALARIKAARASGQQVGVDIYPYINNGLGIRALIHPRHSAAGEAELLRKLKDPAIRREMRTEMETLGGWENWYAHAGKNWDYVIVSGLSAPYEKFNGRSVGEIARAVGKDPWDVFFEIAPTSAAAMPQSMTDANKIKAMREEFTSFDTDAGPLDPAQGLVHPRGYGSFPRLLGRYVRELGVMSVEAMVHRMSAVAANEIMAYDRGRLAPGLAADIIVFDPVTIRDRSTFAEPTLPSEGMRYVLVNGGVVLEGGKYTGAKPGRVIRGPGFKPNR